MVSRRVTVAKKATAKKVAPSKRVAVKKAAAPVPPRIPRGVNTQDEKVDDTQIVWSDNEEARRLGIDNSKPAQTLAKVISLQISIGDYDRKRSMEDLVADINKMLKAVPYGKDGLHASVLSSYYLVDGKVCTPDNFDPAKENFKDGSLPPTWAGGPLTHTPKKNPGTERTTSSSAAISRAQYDAKYGPEGNQEARAKIAAQKEAARLRREGPSDDDLVEEDFEWAEEDIEDDAKLESVAKKSQAAAAKKISVKRTAKKAPAKKVVVAPRNRRESASASTPKKTVRVRKSK